MVSAIGLTDMASCGFCDKSHDLSNHPFLGRDLDKSRGLQYTMWMLPAEASDEESFREERHIITEVRNDTGFDNERDG